MHFLFKKINKAAIVLLATFVILAVTFSTHTLINKLGKEDSHRVFFGEFDLIEESEAEEVSQEDASKDLAEDDGDKEDEEKPASKDREGSGNEENSGAPNIVKKNVTQKQLPSSISKYGLIFNRPDQYKKDALGRLVCVHDNDKPKISTQNKPIHMDMECCLDPDEIPNPYCYYPKKKYGKLLDDFDRKREKMLRKYKEGRGL